MEASLLRSFCSGRNPSTVCFLPLSQIWPAGPFVQQEEPFGCVLLTFQDYDVLWSLGQGINSTKSVLFTLLGCLQMACRCRSDTRVLGTSGSSESELLFMQAHLHSAATCASAGFRSLIRSGADRLNVAGCRLLQITTIHNGNPQWSKGSRDATMFTVHDSLPRSQMSAFIHAFPHATAS